MQGRRRAKLTGVLLSIKPKYVKEILSRAKQYEFRKQIFKDESVKTVFIYYHTPQKKIIACFRVGKIVKGHPDFLWEHFRDVSGISEQEFFEYFSDRDTGYAIKIDKLEQFPELVDPHTGFERFVEPFQLISQTYLHAFIFLRSFCKNKSHNRLRIALSGIASNLPHLPPVTMLAELHSGLPVNPISPHQPADMRRRIAGN